ncbi:LuxE/PaaK family acyltransferase [Syntrophomonas palmitatica]|uniref:LuxE/PaaK family acyltransferase n=1 Tax=Syntrophomonas palmitatica TaxID=402877 RepID=UPI0006D071CF|nr:hypothetical protein [Syntrophomonas palmitatica]
MAVQNPLVIGTIPPIEVDIFQNPSAFFPTRAARESLQKNLLVEAFYLHYNQNDIYKRYCRSLGYGLQAAETDPYTIPLLPSTIFKKLKIRTLSGEATVKKCISSGTQGSISVIERDNTTLERFLGSVQNTSDNVYGTEDAVALNLGPGIEEAKDIWFSFVMSVTDVLYPTIDYVKNGVFNMAQLVNDINTFKSCYQDVFLIGAPPMFMEFYRYLNANHIKFDCGKQLFIVTGGGWKKQEAESINNNDFKDLTERIFPGIERSRIRDNFNAVELNTIIPECECGSKHLPVWADAFVYDLDTFTRSNEANQTGLLCFLDASPTSYPGFIMTEDLGQIIYIDDCPCGRPGKCIDVIRRVNTIESRGCALKIERDYLKQ